MEITPITEIRKLPKSEICELVKFLEDNMNWRKLMFEIRADSFNLDDEKRKYDYNDMRLIVSTSSCSNRFCSEILLDEWGTSGKNRPTVRLLQQYLEKVEIWSAADYIAETLLKEPVSQRPKTGPSRRISFSDVMTDLENLNEETVPMPDNIKSISFGKLQAATNNFDENRILGSGAFGTVYLGEIDGTELAIKKLNKMPMEHFEHELVILSQCVRHNNLLPCLAMSMSNENALYLVYKFMQNGCLEDRLLRVNSNTLPLTWQRRISISFNIAEGLDYLHSLSKPIIHRDIKCSNILLDFDDTAKIADFGLIRIKKNLNTSMTETVQGTAAYMAPESFIGRITPKVDIFAFGLVLLQLLTGLPIILENGEHLMYYVINEFKKIEQFLQLLDNKAGQWNEEVVSKLFRLAKKCFKQNHKDRPESAEIHSELKMLMKESNLEE